MKRVEDFLSRLQSRIHDRRLKKKAAEEIEGHILDSIDALTAEPLSREAAAELTLARLGDPESLGREIQRANVPWFFRWYVFMPSIGVVAAIAFVLYANVKVQEAIAEQQREYQQDIPILELFLKDQALLARDPFFSRPMGRDRNAGEFLNKRIEWEGRGGPQDPQIQFPSDLRRILRKPLLAGKSSWLDLETNPSFARLDFNWMNELHNYDHWDFVEPAGPALTHLQTNQPYYSMPYPSYGAIQLFAKARLLRGLQQGRPLPALRDVRKLAELVHSSESLISSMVAIGLLKIERAAYERSVKKGLLRAGDWTPVPEETLEISRRASWATSEWLAYSVPEEMRQRVFSTGKTLQGICHALNEQAGSIEFLRDNASSAVWQELDFRPYLQFYDDLNVKERPNCRLSLARRVREYKAHGMLMTSFPDSMDEALLQVGLRVPYVRRYLHFVYGMQIRANWTGQYRSIAQAKK